MDDYREEMLELRRQEILLGLKQRRRNILLGDIRLIIYLVLIGVFVLTGNPILAFAVVVTFVLDLATCSN